MAEAPPCDLDRYFYFKDVKQHDWLFRHVWEGLTGDKPARDAKAEHLATLRDRGVYLIDIHEDNISNPKRTDLSPNVRGLIERCRTLAPEHVVLIKSIVYDVAYVPLVEAGFEVIDERMPFPASGQQRRFLESFRRAAAKAGFAKERPRVKRVHGAAARQGLP